VTEETKNADKTPGRAALVSTVILLFTYLLVAVAIQAFAGFEETGIGLANEENSDDVLTVGGRAGVWCGHGIGVVAHRRGLGGRSPAQVAEL
jgi:amino acid transporter